MLEYLSRGFGRGHLAAISAGLVFAANALVTAMVAVAFGEYASALFFSSNTSWTGIFAAAVILGTAAVNVAGTKAIARAQGVIVVIVVGILAIFSVVTLATMKPHLLAPSGYPSWNHVLSGVALTFFAFLGSGIVTFTAKDLARPKQQLPRAMSIALGIALALYVAIALGVFGTLTVTEVIKAGGTALAVAAQPALGKAGYVLLSVTALFATAGATNRLLYPVAGASRELAATRVFPPVLGGDLKGRANVGLLLTVAVSLIMAVFFNLTAIASVGSAVALLIFGLITAGHFRIYRDTGARLSLLVVAMATIAIVLISFVLDTLVREPAAMVALAAIVVLAIIFDLVWSRLRANQISAFPPLAVVKGGLHEY
jgi:amino acid transporter